MKRKIFFIAVPFLILLAIGFLLFAGSNLPTTALKQLPFSSKARAEAARLKLHPLTTEQARAEYMKQTVKTWEKWADQLTENSLGILIECTPDLDTPEKIEKKRTEIREGWEPFIKRGKSMQNFPPQPGEEFSFGKARDFLPMGNISYRRHEGLQTTEALMESFDANYVRITPETSEWDAHYPRDEWVQMLLDKGVHFEDRGDYDQYLDMRGYIIEAEAHPEWWNSGRRGVERVDNFEEYKDAYIRRRVFQQETFKRIRQEDPDMVSLMWPSDRPDKYLVMKGDRLYVRLNPASLRSDMWGKLPTREETRDLTVDGILPKNREVIFIDENYDVISEAEVHRSREEYIEKNAKPFPPDAKETYDEMLPSVDNFDFEDDEFYGENEGFESMEFDIGAARAEAAREVMQKMAEAEKVDFEQFQDDLRQLEEFANMSDAEIMVELERQFIHQFVPELPTDENISKALETLDHHGFEEGFRRIRRDTPAVADLLEKFFGLSSDLPSEFPENIKPSQNPAQPSGNSR